jgi:hypothetical protein
MNRVVGLVVAALLLQSCASCEQIDPEPDTPAVGRIDASVDGTTATLTVSGVAGSLRSVQVDVAVAGGTAQSVAGVGHDLVEAGLGADQGGPKSSFTVVVADTRRLPVNNGAVARLTVDAGASLTLSNAVVVDSTGARHTLSTGGQ